MTLRTAPVIAPVDPAPFEAVRPRLFGIAYWTLESVADADDVVQDTWIRWQRTDRNEVRDAGAFLATTAKRVALNVAAVRSCTPRDVRRPAASRTGERPSRSDAGAGDARRSSSRCACSWRRCLPPNEPPPTTRRSTTVTGVRHARRRVRQTPGNSSPVPRSSPANLAGGPAPPSSSSDSSTPSSTPRSRKSRDLEQHLAAHVVTSFPVAIAA